ncbi:amine oxidase [Seminavis robusta]|uniref:Amine oxidase n=1 Tax=Seminavis robusta TaxID=568900 RepID=A0A9N8EM64_9STRA|nr:amine oxidase [Seminavis robusta]|eukprot:Sro1240_g255350.1 amine oxidase (941) ;mRNA; f:24155-26977
MDNNNYDSLILSHPEVVVTIGNNIYYLLHFFVLCWLLIYSVAGTVLLEVGCRWLPKSFGAMSPSQQYKVIFWALESVVGIISIVEIVLWFPQSIAFHGTIHSARITGNADMDWNHPVSWLHNLNQVIKVAGWAVTPLLLAYLFKLCFFVKEYRLRPLVILHHLVCIGNFMFILSAVLSTLDGKWMELAIIFSLNIALEFPVSIALILYRFQSPLTITSFPIALVCETLLRLTVWVRATVNYWDLCFQPTTLTIYERIWRVYYPFLLLTVLSIEIYTVGIHLTLYHRSKKIQKTTGGEQEAQYDRAASDTVKTIDAAGGVTSANSSTFDMDTADASERQDDAVAQESSTSHAEPTKNVTWQQAFVNNLPDFSNLIISILLVAVFSNPYVLPIADRPAAEPHQESLRVAIVGGGVAGMGAALAFQQSQNNASAYEVDLFEAHTEFGGAASTYYSEKKFEPPFVEHAFVAFLEYYNFEKLLDWLGVEYKSMAASFTIQYETPVSFSNDRVSSTGEILGSSLPPPFNDRNRILKYQDEIHLLAKDLKDAYDDWNEAQLMETTLGEFTNPEHGVYSEDFLRDYLAPCLEAYVATGAALFDMPIALLKTFEARFGLCLSPSRVNIHYVSNGTSAYVEQLRQHLEVDDRIHLHSGNGIVAAQMANQPEGGRAAKLLDSNGIWREYDHVIFTLQRPQVREILDHPSSVVCEFPLHKAQGSACQSLYEQLFPRNDLLGSYKHTIVHSDIDYIAKFTANLSTPSDGCHYLEGYNFLMKNAGDKRNLQRFTNIFNSNNMDPMHCNEHVIPPFQLTTKNFDNQTLKEIGLSPDRIVEDKKWLHPSHDVKFFKLGRSSHAIQGLGSFWFAGAAFNFNFHEEALVSGFVIAERLGAGYMFHDNALALTSFLRSRAWLLYGLNPMMPPMVPRGSSERSLVWRGQPIHPEVSKLKL